MDHSSAEESDTCESEIEEYKDKPYEQLSSGKYKVKHINGALRCPFCAGKKKHHYRCNELFQHALGVGKGSANRSAKQKANHLASAKYLWTDLGGEAGQAPQPVVSEPVKKTPGQEDLYVWPWMGIIVNIVTDPKDGAALFDGGYWLKRFAQYKPLEVRTFWSETDRTAQAVVKFDIDWNGFMNATEFDRAFEAEHHSKREWNEWKMNHGSRIYGWCARADDHNSMGPIGDYLRSEGKLRTISDIVHEAAQNRNNVVADLTDKINSTNENLNELVYKYNEKTMSLSRMLEEKDKLNNDFVEEARKMLRTACENVRRILEEQEKLNYELDAEKKQLDYWSKELNKREALTEQEKQKLEKDIKKNDSRNNSLQLASVEQRRADENGLRLVEEQKREKEEALKKILQLELLFDGQCATGEFAFIPGASSRRVDDVETEQLPRTSTGENVDFASFDTEGSTDPEYDINAEANAEINSSPVTPARQRRRSHTPASHGKKKHRAADVRADLIQSLNKLVSVVNNRTKAIATAAIESKAEIVDCLRILEDIPEVACGGPLLEFALLLFQDKGNREYFSNIFRKDWQLNWLRSKFKIEGGGGAAGIP